MICSLPLMMVIVFLIFTLIVGLYYSRKTTTLKEYAIGHKNFTTATLVATVLATAFGGGGLVRTVQYIHAQGLNWIVLMIVSTIGTWAFSLLTIRMAAFMENLSMAETIGQVYGKLPRIFTALASISGAIASLAIQVNVMTQAINMCINDVNPTVLSIIATLILIIYSTFGGIRAVTTTDVLQCITFVLILPCLAYLMFHKTNKPLTDIFTVLGSYEKFQLSQVFQWNKSFVNIFFIGLMCTIGLSPSTFQRIYMASNVLQARKVFLISSVFDLCISSIIVLIGVFIFIDDPTLPISAIWPAITNDLAPLFKGFLAISLLAMTMSTADSKLNACSIMVVYDIFGSLKTNKISNAHQLRLARITSFVVGLLAMFLAIYQRDLLALLRLALGFYIPIVTAPLFLAIFGFRSSSRTALIGMVTGTSAILVWNKYIPDIEGSVPAMLANGIAMLLAHYSLPKGEGDGWGKPSLEYQQLQQARQRHFYRFKKHINGLFSDLLNMPINTYQIVSFAFYVIISSWIPLFNYNAFSFSTILNHHHLLYWPLMQCFVALAMILYVILAKNAPVTFNRYVWLFALLFCLPMDALWHLAYAQDKPLALALSFCHFGMFALLSPAYLTLSVLGLGLLIMTFSRHSLIAICLDHMVFFLPAVLLLVSLIYMQQRLNKKAWKSQWLEAQQQKAIEQET